MAGSIKNINVKVGADATKFSEVLRNTRETARGLNSELRSVNSLLKFNPTSTTMLTQKQQILNESVDNTRKKLIALNDAQKQMDEQIGPRSQEQVQAYRDLEREIVRTGNQLKSLNKQQLEFTRQSAISNTTLGQWANGMESFGVKHKQLGQSLEGIGSTLTRTLTPAMIGVGAASIVAAVNIDSSLTSVRKTVDGTEEQYQQLKEAAIEFSETNAVSASQILDIQALGAQLGFTIEELDSFAQVVSGLDIATDMDAETAATQLAQFANITKMSHEEISNYASSIVGLGNNFATTESRISEMAMRIAASGTQVGMSQADILGVATALSSLGVEAEAGGTAISTIMASIDKDVAIGSEGLSVWAETARMSASDFASAWQNDPVQALSAVLSGMEEATGEGSNMSLMLDELGISSMRQTDVMKRLAGNSQLMADAVSSANQEWSANTALTKEVDNRNSSLEARFIMVKNQAIAMGESIGGPLADALLDGLNVVKPMVEGVGNAAKAFSEMDEGQQRVIIGIVGAVAVAGPLLSITGKLITNTKSIAGVMRGVAGVLPSVQKETRLVATAQQEQATSSNAAAMGAKNMATGTQAATVGTKGLTVALNALKAVGIMALFAIAAEVIGNAAAVIGNANERTQRIKDSTIDLAGSLDSTRNSWRENGDAAEGSAGQMGIAETATQDVLEAQKELATNLNETWKKIGSNESALNGFTDTIMRLSGQTTLTSAEQAQLQAAVAGFNDITGSSIGIIDAATGSLTMQKDEILAVKDAYIEQARATAAIESVVQVEQQRALAAERLRVEQEKLSGMDEGWGIGNGFIASDENYRAYQEQLALVDELQAGVDNLNQEYEVANTVLQQNSGALSQNAETVQAVVSANQGVVDVLSANGQSAQGFSEAIADLGITQDELAQMTPETLSALATAWNGSNESIQPILDEYKKSVSDTLNQNTRDALAGMNTALQEGQAVTEPQITALREALLYATKDLDQQAQADVIAGMDGIFAALASGTPLTQAQVDQLNAVLGGVGITFAPDASGNIQAGVDGAAATLAGGGASVGAASEGMVVEAYDPLNAFGSEAENAAQTGVDGFTSTVAAGEGEAQTSGTTLAEGAVRGVSSISSVNAGVEFAAGYARGIRGNTNAAVRAAIDMAVDSLEAARNAQESSSPSKKAMRLGGDFGEGYGIGISSMANFVAKSSARLTDIALTSARTDGLAKADSSAQRSSTGTVQGAQQDVVSILMAMPEMMRSAVLDGVNEGMSGWYAEWNGREVQRAKKRGAA